MLLVGKVEFVSAVARYQCRCVVSVGRPLSFVDVALLGSISGASPVVAVVEGPAGEQQPALVSQIFWKVLELERCHQSLLCRG